MCILPKTISELLLQITKEVFGSGLRFKTKGFKSRKEETFSVSYKTSDPRERVSLSDGYRKSRPNDTPTYTIAPTPTSHFEVGDTPKNLGLYRPKRTVGSEVSLGSEPEMMGFPFS